MVSIIFLAKGSQNKDSKIAYSHAIGSIGKFLKCNGIFHKGYTEGDKVPAEDFKRLGETGYQASCSECDQARQSFQKTLKRLAAIIMVKPNFKLSLPSKFSKEATILTSRIRGALKKNTNPLAVYMDLVSGEHKLTVKILGLYEIKLSVGEKKELIKLINNQVRKEKNDASIGKFIKKLGRKWRFRCSTCGKFYPLSNASFNISQSRDIFYPNNQPSGFKLPLHNVCHSCMLGGRSESLRHFKFLCDGHFTEANRKMGRIGKDNLGMGIDADHIIPLRLGGKHDPKNIRELPKKPNIRKKDKLTQEALDYLAMNNISIYDVLSRRYHRAYREHEHDRLSVREVALRHAVDLERRKLKALAPSDKYKRLRQIYPTLAPREVKRLIRKLFG